MRVSILFMLFAFAAQAEEAPTKLNLEDCVERALASATAVEKAKNGLELTGTQLVRGYAQFLPNLAASAGYNSVSGKSILTSAVPTTVDGRTRGGSYLLSSTLNLFNGLADISGLQAALARDKAADLSLARARQMIALDVAQSFLQVVLDQQIVKIAEKNLASSRAREEQLSEQTRVGVRNLTDLFRQQAQTSSDESFFVSSQNRERTDELQLLRKARFDAGGQYEFISPQLEGFPKENSRYADERALIAAAIAARPDLRAQEKSLDAFKWDARAAKSGYFPRLDFGMSVAGIGRNLDAQTVNGADVTGTPIPSWQDQVGQNTVYTVGLTLTWNIFDRWLTKTDVERAEVTARNANLDADDLRNQVVAEVRQAYGDYRTVWQQLVSSAKGLTAAQKAYETVDARYQVGSANFVDLASAQAVLVQADAARAQAVISFALQSRVLETVIGTDPKMASPK